MYGHLDNLSLPYAQLTRDRWVDCELSTTLEREGRLLLAGKFVDVVRAGLAGIGGVLTFDAADRALAKLDGEPLIEPAPPEVLAVITEAEEELEIWVARWVAFKSKVEARRAYWAAVVASSPPQGPDIPPPPPGRRNYRVAWIAVTRQGEVTFGSGVMSAARPPYSRDEEKEWLPAIIKANPSLDADNITIMSWTPYGPDPIASSPEARRRKPKSRRTGNPGGEL